MIQCEHCGRTFKTADALVDHLSDVGRYDAVTAAARGEED
jgi:hypothetical protein